MIRGLLSVAFAAIAGATLLASNANACISCEYTPPVVNTPVKAHAARYYAPKRVYVAQKPSRAAAAKQRFARAEAARSKPVLPKKVVAAEKAAPEAVVAENSAPADTRSDNDGGDAPTKGKAAEKTKVATATCSKFIATTGTTIQIPCE